MPLYFFHIRSGSRILADTIGVYWPDMASAVREAVNGARSVFPEEFRVAQGAACAVLQLDDEDGRPLLTVPLARFVQDPSPLTAPGPHLS